MADLCQMSEGVQRQADVALRIAGGRAVLLRMPQPAVSGDDSEQLGLAVPGFSDAELAPAVFRKADSDTVLLVAASAVESVTGTLAFDSADVLFATATGIVIDGVLYEIVSWTVAQASGKPYAYSLTVKRPPA